MREANGKIYYREDTEYTSHRLTIERRLQQYERHPDKSERSAILWHAWCQNKGWLKRLLELTLASFPSYSRHDASHAEAILHNIERILGESRIIDLSATDCFAILHTVYVHDIGMAILAADREKIVKSDGFIEMIDEMSQGADDDLRKAALQLKKRHYGKNMDTEADHDGLVYHNQKKELYAEKLETYYAVVQLIAEYQRKQHGEKAASSIREWISDENKLRSEFAMSGIPMRIFFRIADCASLHTDWDFAHVLNLPSEEDGYENDMLHPQFIAVLLQLGDALDIDNDRFHPFAEAFLGQFPAQSQNHFEKHLAVRMLKITPEEIAIEADCKSREALRLIKSECDNIDNLLRSASYHWSSIAPKGFSGALPAFQLKRLRLESIEIPLDLAMTRFQISSAKAFSLLQGENIYSGYFPFVRELLQNAIDSTKIQCYKEFMTSPKFRLRVKNGTVKVPSITNISDIINPVEYPIKIVMKCARQRQNGVCEEVDIAQLPEKEQDGESYGILFSIEDYGTGINSDSIRTISHVGSSYKDRRKLLREMPDWLRPTGEFGIGLQSVFLVSDRFYCDTYVRNGERYSIEFLTGANGEKGYINVEPRNPEEYPMAYGTKFEVFISHEKKKQRNDFMDAWSGYDPFAEQYEHDRIRRNIIALAIQILLDIDSQLGDLLFPVYASVQFQLEHEQRNQLKNKLLNIVFDNMDTQDNYTEDNLQTHVCWMYHPVRNDSNQIRFAFPGAHCQVDLQKMKVYLWLEEQSVNVCLGVEWLLRDNHPSANAKSRCKLFYKGILIETRDMESSGHLIEYIDILGGRAGSKLIQLSRNGFTSDGEAYISAEIIPAINRNLLKALEVLAGDKFSGDTFSERVRKNIQQALTHAGQPDSPDQLDWQRQLIGVSLFYNFYMRESERARKEFISQKSINEQKQWELAVDAIAKEIRSNKQQTPIIENKMSHFSATEVYASINATGQEFKVLNKCYFSIADFYNSKNKFAVISKRRERGDMWINSLICLRGTEDDPLPELVKLLENGQREQQRNCLEKWADFMLKKASNIIIDAPPVDESNFVLQLLQSVPISACFCSETGNVKIHILSGHPLTSVFYNVHSKYMLLQKMAERSLSTNAKRFAGNVWIGYEFLKVPAIQEDVCSIKEKYVYENGAFMLLPCSGEAAAELIRLTKRQNGEGSAIMLYNNESNLISVSIANEKCLQEQDATVLYSCLSFTTIYHENNKEKEVFDEKFRDYCYREKTRVSPESFLDQLNRGYKMLLKNIFQEVIADPQRQKERDSWKEFNLGNMKAEELEQKMSQKLKTQEDLRALRTRIYKVVLEQEAIVTTGQWLVSGDVPSDIKEPLQELIIYCFDFEWTWNLLNHLEDEQKLADIRQKFWDDSPERKNLIGWTAQKIYDDPEAVSECYEQIWKEFEEAVACHKRSSSSVYQNKLLDWISNQDKKGNINE